MKQKKEKEKKTFEGNLQKKNLERRETYSSHLKSLELIKERGTLMGQGKRGGGGGGISHGKGGKIHFNPFEDRLGGRCKKKGEYDD